MNALPGSAVLDVLGKQWVRISGTEATFPSQDPVKCIDHLFILRSSAPVEIVDTQAIKTEVAGQASDHLPVVVTLRY